MARIRRLIVRFVPLALFVSLLVSPALPARAQSPPAPMEFPAQVELITIDAVVVDSHGKPVAGLGREDFALTEDGVARDIVSFEPFEDAVQPAAGAQTGAAGLVAARPAVGDDTSAAERGARAYAILLDDVWIAPSQTRAVQEAVRAFLDRSVRDSDLVTLGTTSGEVWWSARLPEGRADFEAVLARLRGGAADPSPQQRHSTQPLTEYEAFEAVNDRIKLPKELRSLANELDQKRRERTLATVAALERAVAALAPVRGRKSLLLLSQGHVQDPDSGLARVAAAARQANTVVYFVDVRGLQGSSTYSAEYRAAPTALPMDPQERLNPSQPSGFTKREVQERVLGVLGSRELAEQTGGFSVASTNDLAAGLERIARESRVFYLLGFNPDPGKPERRWRKLRVRVKRPGLEVHARPGYTLATSPRPAQPSPTERAIDASVAGALDSAYDSGGVPLRLSTYLLEPRPGGKIHVRAVVELGIGKLTVDPTGVARLQTGVVALQRDSGRGFRHDDPLALAIADGGLPGWASFSRDFLLEPGVAQLRVAVRDTANGALGSLGRRILVPKLEGLRLSTPLFGDRLAPEAEGGAQAPVPTSERRFAARGRLYCQFEVFGAVPGPDDALHVETSFTLRAQDGRVVAQAPSSTLASRSDGRAVQIVGIPLETLSAGAYELALEVRDAVSGASLVHSEPFAIADEPVG